MNTPSSSKAGGTQFRQSFVNETPAYENSLRKRKKRPLSSQVIGAGDIIRPDKRIRPRYL